MSPRSQGPSAWVYRWRERSPQGKTVRRSAVLGSVDEIRSQAEALKAAEQYRLQANREPARGSEPTFGALIDRFIREERLREVKDRTRSIGIVEEDEQFDREALDSSTASSYLSMLEAHIRPRWDRAAISEVRPAAVQEWLRNLALAPKTKGHIKALMHRLFEKAMLWELLPVGRNPMQLVHLKGISRRAKKPTVLTPEETMALMARLPEPYRLMVMVAICTGLRASEILALRWSRIDLRGLLMKVKVKSVNGRLGPVKTECSEDDLPLDRRFAEHLSRWKEKCPATLGGWVFPSPVTQRPYHASPIQQDYLRPAGRELRLGNIGWHTFRHTYRSWLDAAGTPIGVQQKLMRHAHPGTTMSYGDALMPSKRAANARVVEMLMKPEGPVAHA